MSLSPRGIREHLKLNRPIYARTAAYGHFGRKPDKDGGFSWEKTDLVKDLKSAFNARSEEHTSELQSLMRIPYAVSCLNKKRISGTTVTTESTERHCKNKNSSQK